MIWLTVGVVFGERTIFEGRVVTGPVRVEWDHFRGQSVESKLLMKFPEQELADQVLLVRQMDVKAEGWTVKLNGEVIGNLPLLDEPAWVPFRTGDKLKKGENTLEIGNGAVTNASFTDQIQLGPVRILSSSELTNSAIQISVKSGEELIPARVTITDKEGTLWPVKAQGNGVAVRPGVIYSGPNEFVVQAPRGAVRVFATRGPEFSLGQKEITLEPGGKHRIELELARQVDTEGWVGVDTHVHTLSLSGHGDATVQERVLSLAGEGLAAAIVTEHNKHATYEPELKRAGLDKFVHVVAGNEVTTRRGHFNVFPVDLSVTPPDHRIEDWEKLLGQIRKTPNVQLVILNHPADLHAGFVPFAATNLVPNVGRGLNRLSFDVDAVEVVNSGAMRSDWMEPYRGWFALLNYGQRVMSVGASDSHDVSRYGVGQGRTYVRAKLEGPALAHGIKAGRAFVSLGLFPMITVNERFGMGELVPASDGVARVKVEVRRPEWITTTNCTLYLNGVAVQDLGAEGGAAILQLPGNDCWLVAIASGPGITQGYWPIPRPYQASTTSAASFTLGSTNPIWIDRDGDGKFTAPREWAERLLKRGGSAEFVAAAKDCDRAVIEQARDLAGLGTAVFDWKEVLRAAEREGKEILAKFEAN